MINPPLSCRDVKKSRPVSVSRPIFDGLGLSLEASGLGLGLEGSGLGLEGSGLINIPAILTERIIALTFWRMHIKGD